MEETEIFLQAHAIDPSAAKELRCEPPHVALAVLERGPLRACTNPSGALVARIRDAKRGILSGNQGRFAPVPPVAPMDPNATETERFLAENRIDVAGAASLRAEPLDIQKLVMSKGPLTNSTNPSASLMARIRNVKANLQQGGGLPGMGGPLPPGQVPLMSGLVTGGGGPPPPPGPPPGPPPLQLEDGNPDAKRQRTEENPSIQAVIDDDVMKAINKLKAAAAQPPPGAMPVGLISSGTAATGPAESPSPPPGAGPVTDEDKALQAEALKAIQALNAAG